MHRVLVQPAGGAALEQDSREQGEKAALVQGSTILEDMEEVGAVALEGAGAGEDRTEGGNDFCYPYHRYYLETYSMIYI